MQEEIGSTAGVIWRALNGKGELSLATLRREVYGKTPVFDWSVGWLAREGREGNESWNQTDTSSDSRGIGHESPESC